MNVLLIATQIAPYFRWGGLADVVRGFAKELNNLKIDARVVVPAYRTFLAQPPDMDCIIKELPIELGATKEEASTHGAYMRTASILKSVDSLPIYFVEQDYYFGRDEFYGYPDDYERTIFFTMAALQMLRNSEFDKREHSWFPEIVHGYDWPTGLIPAWIRKLSMQDKRFAQMRFVLSVHDIRRLGIFGSRALQLAQLEAGGIYESIGERDEQISFLGRGILDADRVVMVNPIFDAIQSDLDGETSHTSESSVNDQSNPLPEPARVLAPLIAARTADGSLTGIRNGIDEDDYDPRNDSHLIFQFSSAAPDLRLPNKGALQKLLGFPVDESIPLLGMASRLIPVTGFDLLPVLRRNLDRLGPLQLAILADTGMPEYKQQLEAWEKEQDQAAPWIKSRFLFDDSLERQIYAGCDLFVIPAMEYPSGITQYLAMRYGAVPLVRSTGALCESVIAYSPNMRTWGGGDAGMGFKFYQHDPQAFLVAVEQALAVYRSSHRSVWRMLQTFNMRQRYDWGEPVARYLEVYTAALEAAPRQTNVQGCTITLEPDTRLLQAILEVDNLPGLGARNRKEILQQAGRIIRGVLGCDAVYVWDMEQGTGHQALELSLDRSLRVANPDENAVAELLKSSAKQVWGQLADTDLNGICQPIVGLAESSLARREGWVAGRSTPIWAHGYMLGRIDVLLKSAPKTAQEDRWLTMALTALAGSFGQRLHTLHEAKQKDSVAAVATALLAAADFDAAASLVVAQAREVTQAEHAWLYCVQNGELANVTQAEPLDGIDRLADLAYTRSQKLSLADWVEAPRLPDGHRRFRSLLATPLSNVHSKSGELPVAVLVLAHSATSAFTRDHEQFIEKQLAPVAAAALASTAWLHERDQIRLQQLRTLSNSLISTSNIDELLKKIVTTTMNVLQAQAASLYLWNDEAQVLQIEAAAGYHVDLMAAAEKPKYKSGEGLTGWIFAEGTVFKADSKRELHNRHWAGKYKALQHDHEPDAYLGIPLKVEERTIGVLKLEDRKSPPAPMTFSTEDQLLGQMMGNIIATVVYNAQVSANTSESKLASFSGNLSELSRVLVESGGRRELMNNIVEKIRSVVGVDAASLFLKDTGSRRLVLEAASGYQAKLKDVWPTPFYSWGEGVTGWIAGQNQPFLATSLAVLRSKGRAKRGKYDPSQDNLQPEFFYGLPLNVEGEPEPIGVLKIESLAPRPFTREDELLVKMMGNVIAAVVYNTQASERKLERLNSGLQALSSVLAGGKGRQELMDNIVNTITNVVGVDAASLFLVDEGGRHLVIQAASGYQVDLVRALNKPQYDWGEGVTGRIAGSKKPFLAASLNELRKHGGSNRGTFDHLQRNKQPESFYGVPLTIEGKEKAIGVLKVERLERQPFTPEEVLLVNMMANIIAAVVYNAELSDKKLAKLSSDIRQLSSVLTFTGINTQEWFQRIMETISSMFETDAASLYLVDDSNRRLVSVAASGYQTPLVKAKAYYEWGEGVTGKIAESRRPVSADTLTQLRSQGTSTRVEDMMSCREAISRIHFMVCRSAYPPRTSRSVCSSSRAYAKNTSRKKITF